MNRKPHKLSSPAAPFAGPVDIAGRLLRCVTRRAFGVGCLIAFALGDQVSAQALAPPMLEPPQPRIAQGGSGAGASGGEAKQAEAIEEVSASDVESDEAAADEKATRNEQRNEKTLRDALELLADPEELRVPERNDSDPIAQISSKSLFQGRRAEVSGNRFALPPISALTTEMTEIGNGEVPEGFRKGEPSPQIELPETGLDRDLPWDWYTQSWAAPNTFFHPLYFEDRMLERHGHQRFPHITPLVSGARFVAQATMLPYLSAIHPPSECHYSLGYFRAGSPVPAFLQRPPYQRKAAAAQLTSSVIGWTIWP